MSAFDDASAAMFADPNFSLPATYTPAGGGSPIALKAIKVGTRVGIFDVGPSRASVPNTTIRLRAADLPSKPLRGATIGIAATTYTVEAAEPAFRGLVWSCDVRQS